MTMKRLVGLGAVAFACFALSLAVAEPGPEPPAKGDRWEYCEVHYRPTTARAAKQAGWGKGGGPGAGAPGGAGGAGGAGGMAQAAKAARVMVRLVTADDEIDASSWDDLATKLKAPAAKKGATAASHKLRVLNHLGRQGWELVPVNDPERLASSVMLFKRKVTK
jgi:hypothetical protein